VIVVEKHSFPATPESPAVLMAVNVSDQAALDVGIKKAMQDDPLILQREIAGVRCYYSLSQNDANKLLWVICVAQQHAFMANDFDILTRVLQRQTGPPLAGDNEFQRAVASWQEDLARDVSGSLFCRLDSWMRVRYELLRAGQMIAPRKTFGGMLGSFLGGEAREPAAPEIDASKLPPFEQVRQYFGTFDAAMARVETGWILCGHLQR
jgi:hypothetical protein